MSDPKHIDQLFQEKFKATPTLPQEKVWDAIQAELDTNRKRKVIPIPLWYAIGGAAVIAVVIGIGAFFIDSTQPTTTITTTTETCIEEEDDKRNPIPRPIAPLTQTSDSESEVEQQQGSGTESTRSSHQAQDIQNVWNPATRISAHPHNESNQEMVSEPVIHKQNVQESPEGSPTPIATTPPKSDPQFQMATAPFSTPKKDSTATASNPFQGKELDVQEKRIVEQPPGKTLDFPKKSILDPLVPEEDIAEKKETPERWTITPVIAPIYSSVGNRSTIDEEFSKNTSNEIDLSYGIQVSYAVTSKLKVRSGIHRMNLSQTTNDVNLSFNTIENVVGTTKTSIREIEAVTTAAFRNGNSNNVFSQNTTANQIQFNLNPNEIGEIGVTQEINYIEVPFEVNYLINRNTSRFRVHVISGISTLFLEKNDFTLTNNTFADERSSSSSTLNEISFSGNLGIGIAYDITQHFQFTLEPIFKYQFNTFSETAQEFTPYYFGAYTGISFKF